MISAIDVAPVRNGSADATTTKLIALLMITRFRVRGRASCVFFKAGFFAIYNAARNRTPKRAVESWAANVWASKGPGTMANVDDAELQRLKEAVRVACQRVTQIIQTVTDPAAIKAATDICAEAVAALRGHLAKRK